MKFTNKIKGWWKTLKKGGDTMDIQKLPSALSQPMATATLAWWQVFRGEMQKTPTHNDMRPIRLAATSTAYLARLVCAEIKLTLPDGMLNRFVQRNLLPNLSRITQKTLVGGYTVIKPYITESGQIFFDVATSRDFKPISFDELGRITEGEFSQRIRYNGKIYERREYHRFDGNSHYIRNTAHIYGNDNMIELSEVPQWAGLREEGVILSAIPMIATFRTPYENNIDPDSPLPISMYANAMDALHDIDEAHSEYRAEFRKTKAKVFGDNGIFDRNGKITDDYFVNVDGDGQHTMEQQLMVYSPAIREDALRKGLETELRTFEMQVGLSTGTFTFDTQRGIFTATQVVSEDKTTFDTACQMQEQLRAVLVDIAAITANLARAYGMEVTDGEPVIEFGDSVFEDTGTEFNRRLQLVGAGALRPELLNAWYFGVNEEQAREMLPSMQSFGGD